MKKKKEIKTAELYSNLWNKDNIHYFNLTKDRFLNYVNETEEIFKDKKILDAGVGGGTKGKILSELGGNVYGIDIGKKPKQYKGKFITASVLDLPFKDNMFDIIYCDGVLHHTTNPRKGFNELTRVLKPKGKMILMIHGKSGLFGFSISLARLITLKMKVETIRKLLNKFLSKDKTELMLDYFCVPIMERYSEKEIRNWFKENNYTEIRRFYGDWNNLNSVFCVAKKNHNLIYKLLHGTGWIMMKGIKK